MQEIVHAILLVGGKYVLQLRDDKPEIPMPGMWSLFGGSVDKNEDHCSGIIRELKEELNLSIDHTRYLWKYEFDEGVLSGEEKCFYFHEANITNLWGSHELLEGQDVGCFFYRQLQVLNIPPLIQIVLSRYHRERFPNNPKIKYSF
jgi:8-oxo-dGTP pyrophosphatase MutT (NUDIX family)